MRIRELGIEGDVVHVISLDVKFLKLFVVLNSPVLLVRSLG